MYHNLKDQRTHVFIYTKKGITVGKHYSGKLNEITSLIYSARTYNLEEESSFAIFCYLRGSSARKSPNFTKTFYSIKNFFVFFPLKRHLNHGYTLIRKGNIVFDIFCLFSKFKFQVRDVMRKTFFENAFFLMMSFTLFL